VKFAREYWVKKFNLRTVVHHCGDDFAEKSSKHEVELALHDSKHMNLSTRVG